MFEKPTKSRPVDFQHLETTNQESVADSSVPPLFRKLSFVVVKPGYQPTFLPQASFYIATIVDKRVKKI